VISIGFALLAIGVSDILAGGLAGQPVAGRRTHLALLTSVIVMLVLCGLCGFSASAVAYSVAIVGGYTTWLHLRATTNPSERRSATAAACLVVTLAVAVLFAPAASATLPAAIGRWLHSSPVPVLRALEPANLVVGLGVLSLHAASTNALVRAVLRASGTEFESSAGRLRGGRVIGMLERWMVFGFAVCGEPTAAALVVSAKSIVRFPELSSAQSDRSTADSDVERTGPREIDHVTEYFLLGSMVSWISALIPAALLAGTMS